MRFNESQKNPYYFISEKKFKDRIKNNLFFEYAKERYFDLMFQLEEFN